MRFPPSELSKVYFSGKTVLKFLSFSDQDGSICLREEYCLDLFFCLVPHGFYPEGCSSDVLEPTHERSKDAIDDHHWKTTFLPKLIGGCYGGSGCLIDSGQRGLEAVDGVEHTVGVPDGKVEEVVDAGV